MKKRLPIIIVSVIFLIGLSVLLYPSISEFVNSRRQTEAAASYDASVLSLSKKDYTKILKQAQQYNKNISGNNMPYANKTEALKDYESQLSFNTSGVMAYIKIHKINVKLPIYHGTKEEFLQIGVGHIDSTSLPIGGENTHAVLSAHRGLPSAKLFTNLDQMNIGDTFEVHVLDQVLTYKVDKVLVVEPHEVGALSIIDGEDYVTLVTCTPYAINTHRLLVRGSRVVNSNNKIKVFDDAELFDPSVAAAVLAVPILIVILVISVTKKNVKKQNNNIRNCKNGSDV